MKNRNLTYISPYIHWPDKQNKRSTNSSSHFKLYVHKNIMLVCRKDGKYQKKNAKEYKIIKIRKIFLFYLILLKKNRYH